jgi:putative endonuclease
MTYYVYILYSETINQYYVGQTQNIEERLQQHRNSRNKSTKKASDWVLVYSEVFAFRADSVNRESEIKKKKSRKYIENLIQKGSNTIG